MEYNARRAGEYGEPFAHQHMPLGIGKPQSGRVGSRSLGRNGKPYAHVTTAEFCRALPLVALAIIVANLGVEAFARVVHHHQNPFTRLKDLPTSRGYQPHLCRLKVPHHPKFLHTA